MFIGIWLARYLGPENFGILSYALAFIAFFSWASSLGLEKIIVREVVKKSLRTNQLLGTAFFMKLIGACLSFFIILLAINSINPDDDLIILVVCISSLVYIFHAFDVIAYFYEAKVSSKNIVIINSIAFICSSVLNIYFILAEYSVIYFAITSVIEIFIVSLLMIFVYSKTLHHIKYWRFDKGIAFELLEYSWPLMISSFLISIHMKLDQVMIESILDLHEVGLYSVAVKLSESWYFIPTIIVSTLMPYFIKLREKNNHLYHLRLMQLFSLMFIISLVVGVIVIIFGQETIIFLFGEEYQNSYYALIFNIWGGIFISQGLVASIWLISENLQIYRLYIQFMAVIVNIGLNLILIERFGIIGAAISTFMTYFFATWIFGLFFTKTRQVTIMMIKSLNPIYMILLIKEKVRG